MRGWTGGNLFYLPPQCNPSPPPHPPFSHLSPYSVSFLPKLFFSHPTVSQLPPPRLPAPVLAVRPLTND